MQAPVTEWHRVLKEQDIGGLSNLLAEDAVFHSPILHTPQRGKAMTQFYLMGASQVLGNETFTYIREINADNQSILEFTCEVDGITVNGVDMITWNEDGKISDFKVMLRPLKAITLVQQKMQKMLESMA